MDSKHTTITMGSMGGDKFDGFDDGFGTENVDQPASLQFQSFDDDAGRASGFADVVEEEPMLDEPSDDYNPESEYPMYRLNFYRQYFNIETTEIVSRIRRALLPIGVDFLDSIHSKPDLYGPFWTVTTLVFLVGVCGNINDRINGRVPTTGSEFEKISAAASFLYMYHTAVPFLLWLYARTKMQNVKISLVEFLCLFGYSNIIYVPVACLSIIQHPWVRWFACSVGFLVSTWLLVQSLRPVMRQDKMNLPILLVVVFAQLGFAFLLLLYFFAHD